MGKRQGDEVNLQIAMIYEGFAEALTLATKLGVETDRLLPRGLDVGAGQVPSSSSRRDFSPSFRRGSRRKIFVRRRRVRLPGLEAVEEVYDAAAKTERSGLRGWNADAAGEVGRDKSEERVGTNKSNGLVSGLLIARKGPTSLAFSNDAQLLAEFIFTERNDFAQCPSEFAGSAMLRRPTHSSILRRRSRLA